MFWVTQISTLAVALINALLSALTTRPAGALLTTPTMHLYTANSASITPNSTVSQFTEATFTGYAAVALTFSGVVTLPGGIGEGVIATANFIAGAITTGQNILGYWVDDTAGHFYGAEAFPNPVPITNPGNFVQVDFIIPIFNPVTGV